MKNALLAGLMILLGAPPGVQADLSTRRTPVVVAVESVAPATVNITSTQEVQQRINPFMRGNPVFEEFFRRFQTRNRRTEQSLGTGVIIDQGYVLTNEHVLAGATQIRVTLGDGREYDAELIGGDPATDLAVVRILTDEKLPTAKIGNSDVMLIGETVIAIGNAFGLNHTVTTGVLSAINRSIPSGDRNREYHGFIQTDASINPGNSGGPLVNLDGELIGINTMILGNAEGIGFAIPINRAQRVVDDLIAYGEVVPTWMGLRLQEITPSLRAAMSSQSDYGVLVSYVFEKSPAERAGIRSGDILLEFDSTRIRELRNYFEILRGLTDNDEATILLERNGEKLALTGKAAVFPEERAEELGEILLGVEVTELTDELARKFQIRPYGGLMIKRVIPRSPASLRGLRPGDVILKVNQDKMDGRVAFRRAVTKLRGRGRVLLLVQRGDRGYPVSLELS